MMKLIARYDLSGTSALYLAKNEVIGLVLTPTELAQSIDLSRACRLEPLIQLKLLSDDFNDGFTNGLTLRGSQSTRELRLVRHARIGDTIETELTNQHGHTLIHRLTLSAATDTFVSSVEFVNTAQTPATLELLSSFALGDLSPFDAADSELYIHRFQTYWSAEGRHRCESIEDLHLEKAWAPSAVRCERFGSIGSMPVRQYFPTCVVEDRRRGAYWGVQLAHPASWQMELAMQDDALAISGGLADRDFGHWHKRLDPGERFLTPDAILAACVGDLDAICHKLTQVARQAFLTGPEPERTLPVACNEFCTTWGNPTLDNIRRIADGLAGRGVRYLVIDCGWYGHVDWATCMGDWEADPSLFPHGLKEAADYIRAKGMIPGLWFEMESIGVNAKAFPLEEHMLKRDGVTITVGSRRFWNMTDPWVQDYLKRRVIDLLRSCGFGYLKVDYNNSIGIGCDDECSLGEGLRKNMEATQAFFRRIKAELPELVIENCASGGHRLEPSMMRLVSQASFSDAHECTSIPIIAANLHRLIHPAQEQIWAVLRKTDDDERLYYSIVSTFLGRMCLSGDLCDLSAAQWALVQRGIDFYREIAPLILNGQSHRYGPDVPSYNHPSGWQGMLRTDGREALYVVHTYQYVQAVPLPLGWRIQSEYGSDSIEVVENGTALRASADKLCAKAFHLVKV